MLAAKPSSPTITGQRDEKFPGLAEDRRGAAEGGGVLVTPAALFPCAGVPTFAPNGCAAEQPQWHEHQQSSHCQHLQQLRLYLTY